MDTAVSIRDLHFGWPELSVGQGDKIFIQGVSGSGKTTLLSLLAGVLKPDGGRITLLGQDITQMNSAARDRFRADHIGFIFQQFNLIPYLSVIENVMLACAFSHRRKARTQSKNGVETCAEQLIERLGLSEPALLKKPVVELSVGQQQRVAAARSLIGSPEMIIADEPTSSLDDANRKTFLELLFNECEEAGTTLIFVSHDTGLSARFDRTVHLAARHS